MISPLYGSISPLRIPTKSARALSDSDAIAYITAVESADGQTLEGPVKFAIEDFIVGCKSDGIWSAIKASCILAGARTLSGALVPLVGTAPTSNNFVSGDYNRKTGLKGDGSTKWLDSNRNNNAEPQNSKHLSAWVTSNPTTSTNAFGIIGTSPVTGSSHIAHNSIGKNARLNASSTSSVSGNATGFFGSSRNSSTQFSARAGGTTTNYSVNSDIPQNRNLAVFAFRVSAGGSLFTDGRLSFYSIGENIVLASLDTRVSTLMTDLAAAIP